MRSRLHVPHHIQSLVPYVPGKPIEETQRELGLKRVIKLASNENPLGPSHRALKAIVRALPEQHRYPDAAGYRLKTTLANHLGVSFENIVLGNGSNEVIDFLIRAFSVPGDAIATHDAAFIAYAICAQIHGVKTLKVPLDSELMWDPNALLKLVKSNSRIRMVFLANPNNPTGTYMPARQMRAFLSKLQKIRSGSVLAVLDYAYWEYVTASDLPDPIELFHEFSNVVILRTFSKIYGLAGLRAGYGIARPEVAAVMEKIRQPFNMNSLALVAAEAAIEDRAFVKQSLQLNQAGMKFWTRLCDDWKIHHWPSQGNFLLIDVRQSGGRIGGEVFQSALAKGVIFRPVANYGLPHALRISIGDAAENRFAAKALEAVLFGERPKAGRPTKRSGSVHGKGTR